MKMKKLLLLALTVGLSWGIKAQTCTGNFASDDFTSSAGWTAMGAYSGSNPGTLVISGGILDFNAFRGRQNYRLVKSLGCTLTSSDIWRSEFKFNSGSASTSDYGFLFGITEKDDHYNRSNTPGNYTYGDNSCIFLNLADPLGSNGQLGLSVGARYTTSNPVFSTKISLSRNTDYYIRMERIASDKVVLSVYSDNQYTNHINGSPVCYDLDDRITDLKYAQFSTGTTAGTSRTADANVDDFNMFDNTIEDCAVNCDVTALMEVEFEGCMFKFSNNSSVGPGNTYMGAAINFGDGTYQQYGSNPDIRHSYRSPGIYDACITAFSYIYDGENYVCCQDKYCVKVVVEEENLCFDEDNSSELIASQCSINAGFNINETCDGNVTLTNTSSMSSGNYLTTVIDFGDGSGPFERNPGQSLNYQYNSNGTYYVCVTVFGFSINGSGDFECCSDKHCDYNTIYTVGQTCGGTGGIHLPFRVKSPTTETTFSLSPNPVKETLKVSMEEGKNIIRVMSLSGQLVFEKTVENTTVENIDMSVLPAGVYTISVQNGKSIETQKVIKQ